MRSFFDPPVDQVLSGYYRAVPDGSGGAGDDFHHAIQGLITLESDPDKQAKYADWVDIYTQLDDNEINEYAKRYPEEENTMVGFAQRYREEGISIGEARGEARGEVKGEAQTLLKLVKLRFGECPDWVESKLNTADRVQLDQWVAGILTATTLEELFADC